MTSPLDLTDNDDQKTKTGKTFSSLQLITVACHSVLNVQFTAPDPKPDWFDSLNAKLDAAKAVASEWVLTLAPEVSKTIPLSVINFAPTYEAVTDQILKIANAHPDATGKDNEYVQQISGLFSQALLPQLNTTLADMDQASDALAAWGQKLQTVHDDLSTGAASIQNTLGNLQVDIQKMNDAIDNLHQVIAGENQAIAGAAAAIGIGLFALVGGIALAFVTFGAGLVIAGIGGAAIIGGAITWGVMQARINDQFNQIAADQQELAADQRQIVALQGLALGAKLAVSSLEQASSTLSDLRTSWGVFTGEIQGVITKVEAGEAGLGTLVQEVFAQSALTEWNLALQYAQQLAEVADQPMAVQTKILPMSTAA